MDRVKNRFRRKMLRDMFVGAGYGALMSLGGQFLTNPDDEEKTQNLSADDILTDKPAVIRSLCKNYALTPENAEKLYKDFCIQRTALMAISAMSGALSGQIIKKWTDNSTIIGACSGGIIGERTAAAAAELFNFSAVTPDVLERKYDMSAAAAQGFSKDFNIYSKFLTQFAGAGGSITAEMVNDHFTLR